MPAVPPNPLWLAEPVFGPVCVWEVTRAGRRLVNFLARVGYVAFLAFLLFVFADDLWGSDYRALRTGRADHRALAQLATRFFEAFITVQFCVVVGLTPLYTAGTVTDEKERRTLVFLLSTGLTGREVVLGKVAARTAHVLLFVLAGLPILTFLQLFGGVEPVMLAGATVGTALTVLGVAATGAVASVFLNKTRDAILVTYGVGFAYLFGSGWMYFDAQYAAGSGMDWLNSLTGGRLTYPDVAAVVGAGNPVLFVERAYAGSGDPREMVSASIAYAAFYLVVAAVGLGVAAGFVRSAARDPAPASTRWKWVNWVLGRRTTARRHPPVSDAPVRWRESYTGSVGIWKRAVAALTLGVIGYSFLAIVYTHLFEPWAAFNRFSRDGWWAAFAQAVQMWAACVTVGLGFLILFGTAVHAAASVTGEKENDTWVSLLTSPLTAEELAVGKWWGAIMAHRKAIYLLAAVWFIDWACTGLRVLAATPYGQADERVGFAFVKMFILPVALPSFFFLYLRVYSWIGVFASTAAPKTLASIVVAVPLAAVASGGWWLVIGCCCMLSRFNGGSSPMFDLVGITLAELTPPVMGVGLVFSDEILRDASRSYAINRGIPVFLVIGFAVSAATWWVAGFLLKEACIARMRDITNRHDRMYRETGVQPTGAVPDWTKPAPPPSG